MSHTLTDNQRDLIRRNYSTGPFGRVRGWFAVRQAERQVNLIHGTLDAAKDKLRDIKQTTDAALVPAGPSPSRVGKPDSKVQYGRRRYTFTKDRSVMIQEYDLQMLLTYYEGDTYVKETVQKYVAKCLKQGFKIVSKNPKVVEYIKRRLFDIERATGQTFEKILAEQFHQLLLYSNLFISFRKGAQGSTGSAWKDTFGVVHEPISGIFTEDASRMYVEMSQRGEISRYIVDLANVYRRFLARLKKAGYRSEATSFTNVAWNQFVSSVLPVPDTTMAKNFVTFRPDYVMHVKDMNIPGAVMAMPSMWPAIGDIDSLRTIEECVELIAWQLGHPILQGIAGTDKKEGEPEEVTELRIKLENMEANGLITTTNRVKLEFIGAEGKAIDMQYQLKHFKERVMSGISSSPMMMGEGDTANRGTATVLDANSQEKVIYTQTLISTAWRQIFDVFLFEGGITFEQLTEQNRAYLQFPDSDLDAMVKREEHAIQMWTNNLLSRSESRLSIGREPEPDTTGDMFLDLVSIPLAKEQAAAKATVAAAKLTGSRVNPSNQSGTKRGGGRPRNDGVNDMDEVLQKLFDRESRGEELTAADWQVLENALQDQLDSMGMTDTKLSARARSALSASDFCGPNRTFPLADCGHIKAAEGLVGRYKGTGNKSSIRASITRKKTSMKCGSGDSTSIKSLGPATVADLNMQVHEIVSKNYDGAAKSMNAMIDMVAVTIETIADANARSLAFDAIGVENEINFTVTELFKKHESGQTKDQHIDSLAAVISCGMLNHASVISGE